MRTEMEKLIQQPVEIILGGGKYTISPLPIKHSIPWVKKLLKLYTASISLNELEIKEPADVGKVILQALAESPEQLVELFWEYAKNLDRVKLEEIASSSEIMAAFQEVLEFEKPFLSGMTALKTISQ